MKYEELQRLNKLRQEGAITEEEYQREKEKILNESSTQPIPTAKKALFGMAENTYLMLMHISQLAGVVILPGLGYIIPLFMWFSNKDTNENVNKHGKNIINFTISYLIYTAIAGLLVLLFVGVLVMIAIGIIWLIAIIIATLHASKGEYYKYPFIIEFFK